LAYVLGGRGSVRRRYRMAQSEVRVVHTRVFASGPGGGNPCPVVLNADALTQTAMQELARQFGLDTAFVLRPSETCEDLRIRYFVPGHEMGISGHATIAAITALLAEGLRQLGPARIETASGVFTATSSHGGSGYSVTLEQNWPVFGMTLDPGVVAPALCILPEAIDLSRGPIQAVSVSRAKLLVPIRAREILDRLQPNDERLCALCEASEVSGLYPFVRETDMSDTTAEARQFPLRAGFTEDPATGVAAAALGAYLTRHDRDCVDGQHEFRIAQGRAMGRPSLIEVLIDCARGQIIRTAIRGRAEVLGSERTVAG
jgi:trans-2,3-dihydro-3-hydroxyanthranilate isomerase